FPIGGVAAVDAEQGAVSPGGVGYDINCGVRVVTTQLHAGEVRPHMPQIIDKLFAAVPTGVGASKAISRLDDRELKKVLAEGARWAADRGYAAGDSDPEHCEEGGCLKGADPEAISARALDRGRDQV